jgi:hypothetical protein
MYVCMVDDDDFEPDFNVTNLYFANMLNSLIVAHDID